MEGKNITLIFMQVLKEICYYQYMCVWYISKITLLVELQTFKITIAKLKLIYIKISINVAVHQVNCSMY